MNQNFKINNYRTIVYFNLLLLSLIISTNAIFANDSTKSNSIFSILGDDVMFGLSDAGYLLKELINPGIGHVIYPAAAISSTYIASQFDDKIRYPEHSRYTDKILKQPGEISTAIVLPSAIYLSGLIFKDAEVRTTGRLLFESLILAGATNGVLKFAIGRARPYMNLGNNQFEYFETGNDYQSLPSGHTTVAFTCASLLSERINNIYASIALYGIACGTAYERIRSDNHWFSDVVLGAGIGIFSSYSILNADKSRVGVDSASESNNGTTISLLPDVNSQSQGFSLVIRW